MTKFLNKKEQVYDLQLTSYGKYLLSIGKFKPVYYAFFDDNVLYDKTYATGTPALATCALSSSAGGPGVTSICTSSMINKSIILEDAAGTTHTTYFNCGTGPTTSTAICIGHPNSGSTPSIIRASASLEVISDVPADFTGEYITLIDVEGNEVTFTGNGSKTAAERSSATAYAVGMYGLTTAQGGPISSYGLARDIAFRWDEAFDLAYTNGDIKLKSYRHAGSLDGIDSISGASSKLLLKQKYGGLASNTTIDTDVDTDTALTVSTKVINGLESAIPGFRGGTGGVSELAAEVAKSINLANENGLIAMKATSFGAKVTLIMDAIGTDGNGKTITGTLQSGDEAVVTTFAAGSNLQYEAQNDVFTRIKDETQYLEGFVLFRDLDDSMSELKGGYEDYEEGETITPVQSRPGADIFRFDRMIGDAWLDGDSNKAPAWKIVSLQSNISSSAQYETGSYTQIPQVNYTLNYGLTTQPSELLISPNELQELEERTLNFIDGDVIRLESDNPLIYIDEVNTELLTENFDIEVFMVTGSENRTLERKYFQREIPQIVNGLLISETQKENLATTFTTNSVEYYFDVLVDAQIDPVKACRGAEIFNKQSYYVDLEFDCATPAQQDIFFDIYGSATEPEICLD